MDRRTFMIATPALGLLPSAGKSEPAPCGVPSAAEILPPSPLAAVWAEYQQARAAFEASEAAWLSPQYWAEREPLDRCERIAREYEPQTLQDLAWQIKFAHADEEYISTLAQSDLVYLAERIVGLAVMNV